MTPDSSVGLSLDQLSAGSGDPVVVVDFVQFSTAQPLSEELSRYGSGHPVFRIDPVTDLAREQAYRPFEDLVEGYVERCLQRGLDRGPLAVVGHCSAAALALAMAARLGGRAPVSSVLVRPMWADDAVIAADFRGFRTDLGADPGPVPDLTADPDLGLRQMSVLLRDDLRAMALTHDLDPASAALGDMLARYRAWLGFLLAGRAGRTGPRQWPDGTPPPVLLLDADAEPVLPGFEPGSCPVVRLPAPDGTPRTDAALADQVLACVRPAGDRTSS